MEQHTSSGKSVIALPCQCFYMQRPLIIYFAKLVHRVGNHANLAMGKKIFQRCSLNGWMVFDPRHKKQQRINCSFAREF